jgi:hypothetical protein
LLKFNDHVPQILHFGYGNLTILKTDKWLAQYSNIGGSGVSVAGSDIAFSARLKSLVVTLDQSLSFEQHVQNNVKASNYHIKALRHIRPVLNKSVANTVACSIATSRLDYCNSLLYGTSAANIKKLQRVQNNLARVVAGTRRRDSITPVLKDLHWLPIEQRIRYKVASITHKVLQDHQPRYLVDLALKYYPTRQLRSSSQCRLTKPSGLASRIGSQAFSNDSEEVWNSLSIELRNTTELTTFKTKLKTHLYDASQL